MDALDLENLVRHETLIQHVGLGKPEALRDHLFEISPYTEARPITDRFGGVLNLNESDLYDQVAGEIQKADIIVCATGSTASMRAVSAAFPDKTIFFVWAGPGGVGGRIWKQMPGQACFDCFCFYGESALGKIPDNGEAAIYPTGCGFPTFTGRMYDLEIIGQWATKTIVSTALAENHWTATENAFLVDGPNGKVDHWSSEPHQDGSAASRRRARELWAERIQLGDRRRISAHFLHPVKVCSAELQARLIFNTMRGDGLHNRKQRSVPRKHVYQQGGKM